MSEDNSSASDGGRRRSRRHRDPIEAFRRQSTEGTVRIPFATVLILLALALLLGRVRAGKSV